jgi:hypothetical protein
VLERIEQCAAVEGVDARIDLADRKLCRIRIARHLRLDDAHERPVVVAHDPPVAGGIEGRRGDDRRGGPCLAVCPRELDQHLRLDQRHVPRQHDHGRVALDIRRGRRDSIGRPPRLLLNGGGHPTQKLGIDAARGHHHHRLSPAEGGASRLHAPQQQRLPAEVVRELRCGRAHPRSRAGGEDDDRRGGHLREPNYTCGGTCWGVV